MVQNTVSGLAIAFLQETLDNGGTVEIPSLGIKIQENKMHIIAQFDPSKTSDPITFEEEFKSRLHVAFPGATIIVYPSTLSPVTLVSGGDDEADRKRILAEVERQRSLIGF